MTKNEKYAYLEESGWETKSKGLWWKKDGENTRMNEAVDHQKEVDASKVDEWVNDPMEWEPDEGGPQTIKVGTPLVAESDGNIRPMKPSDITIPESVKETLDPYPHIGANYSEEILKRLGAVTEAVKSEYEKNTYSELTAIEERLHA